MVASKKYYNNKQWTEARFRTFIMSALRNASMRWPPKYEVKKEAKRGRGRYLCAGYRRTRHIVPVSIIRNNKRRNNVFVDHITPVVDPKKGFKDWNTIIERMFCEKEGLQVLCKSCHDKKTADERKKKK